MPTSARPTPAGVQTVGADAHIGPPTPAGAKTVGADAHIGPPRSNIRRTKQVHTRKSPRLQSYDYSQAVIVFVTVCVNNRAKILCSIREPEIEGDAPETELFEIGMVVERYTESIPGIDKYVIMPNHVHMIVENRTGETISQKIRSWKTLISKEIGKSIWQRSFYDHVIRDEKDYLVKWKYIDDNPIKWASDEYFQK